MSPATAPGSKRRTAPPRTIEPAECQAPASAERVSCRKCGKVFAGGSVVTLMPGRGQSPGYSARLRQHFVVRVLYCDHCDHLQTWDQACDERGRLEDAVLSQQPTYITRRKDIDWHLRTYPQLAGVSQG